MIYFDAGATTLEKPDSVRRAMALAVRTMSSPGRGSHPASRLAEETAFRCRSEAAELFGVPSPEQVIFTGNATHGLNIAIKALVKPGARVIISGYEHNAVTRPLYAVGDVELVIINTPLFQPQQMVVEFETALQRGADAVICNHVSNVFGYILPMEEIAALCRKSGVPLIVDASQSAGVLPVRLDALGAAFIAMPGHKGLYGPQGTGLLLCGQTAPPIMEGGTGSQSRLQEMPATLPDRLEAGTHNMPGIAGLLEGIRFVRKVGSERLRRHQQQILSAAAEALGKLPQVKLYEDTRKLHQTGVLSFTVDGWDCEELGEQLARRGIAVRAGLHCAPLAHRTVGTLETGTVRMSISAFNTAQQAAQLAGEVGTIIRENARF